MSGGGAPSRRLLLAGRARAEHRERGSRFLALAAPVRTAGAARTLRETERRRHHDATHHVLAARLADGTELFDDDGEPSGTAGRPALARIEAAGLHDAAVVVTRWFGGTKLGTGGLARAYAAAAAAALAAAPRRAVRPGRRFTVRYQWADTGAVARVLEEAGAVRLEERFAPEPELEVAVDRRRAEALAAAVRDVTSGRAEIRAVPGTMWIPDDT